MNEIVYFLVLLFLGIWEVWLAYVLVEEIFSLKTLKAKRYSNSGLSADTGKEKGGSKKY